MRAQTAKEAGLAGCHTCSLLTPLTRLKANHGHCPRCGSFVHQRKTDSLNRCWALVVAAAIFYLPANLLPMTRTMHLGKVQDDTIMSGVIYFFATGSWPIALVIFIASVFVPLLKLAILSGLLVSGSLGRAIGASAGATVWQEGGLMATSTVSAAITALALVCLVWGLRQWRPGS